MDAEHVLILSYNLPSCYMVNADGEVNPLYRRNDRHPFGEILWASAGLFSDGVGALVLRRDPRARGHVFTRGTRSRSAKGRASPIRWCTSWAAVRCTPSASLDQMALPATG